jgi:glycosyltransferase involved in cell wall biosynthesis
MPEVAGDAALLVDPFSIPSITDALQQIATNADLREDLIEKGRERRKMFSWQKTSERLWCSMEKLIEQID